MDENLPRDPGGRPGPAQQPLPFDDESDRPIPYALTARARRTVAPESVPALRVVGRSADAPAPRTPAADDDPADTRPARARALRRAGLGIGAIATRLGCDELLVRAWTGQTLLAVGTDDTPAAVVLEPAGSGDQRRHAAAEAAARLRTDADFAAGVALLAVMSEAGPHALTLAGDRLPLVARSLDWLRVHAPVDDGRVRVVVRVGRGRGADAVRVETARRLGVEAGRVTVTRWPGAPSPDAADVLVRVHDPALAALVGGWCEAFLRPPKDADGLAF